MGIITSWKRRRAVKLAEQRAKARSDEIDLQIKEESAPFRRPVNVLLISIPESEAAAFTLVKHMKIHHLEGRSYEELSEFRKNIWKILLTNSRNVVRTLQLTLEHVDHAVNANCEFIMNHRVDTHNPDFLFLPQFAQVIQDLWAEEIIPELLDRASDLSLDDDAAYFFAEARRIVAEGYIPSAEDILHVPPVRKGVMETYFKMGQLPIRISQVCGQCNQKMWRSFFEGVTTILFYASLSDYNTLVVAGSGQETRLARSLALFETVINSRWFWRSSVVLFLAEIREFMAKLPEVRLDDYFPEYTGGPDVNKGTKYILWQFMQANRARLNVYPHITDPSDTSNLRLVFVTLKETILQNALRESGIF